MPRYSETFKSKVISEAKKTSVVAASKKFKVAAKSIHDWKKSRSKVLTGPATAVDAQAPAQDKRISTYSDEMIMSLRAENSRLKDYIIGTIVGLA